MDAVLKFFQQALALLNALVASGVVKVSSGAQISTIVADIEAVVAGAQHPTADLATQVAQLLTDLKVDGIIGGQVIDTLIADAQKYTAFVKDVQSGQSIILDDKAKLAGVAGLVVFAPLGSDQAKSLGY